MGWMRFVSRYYVSFLFVVLVWVCGTLMVRQENYLSLRLTQWVQHALLSSNAFLFQWHQYMVLRESNALLREENQYLHEQLYNRHVAPRVAGAYSTFFKDSAIRFIEAQVIYQTMTGPHNFMTLNKGNKAGLRPGQGIASAQGLCGRIQHSTEDFSVAYSLLHTEMRTSVRLGKQGQLGSIQWNGLSRRYATLEDMPRHVHVHIGDTAYTSGYGAYPQGIPVGMVVDTKREPGAIFHQIKVRLLTDFNTLRHVYALDKPRSPQQDSLENLMRFPSLSSASQ